MKPSTDTIVATDLVIPPVRGRNLTSLALALVDDVAPDRRQVDLRFVLNEALRVLNQRILQGGSDDPCG
jgi:hypothetical protein